MPKPTPRKLRYWHIYLKPAKGVTIFQVEKCLNQSMDWFRYDDNCFILYSTASIDLLKSRFQPLAKSGGGRLLIAPLDLQPGSRTGWMPQKFWDWLKTHADSGLSE